MRKSGHVDHPSVRTFCNAGIVFAKQAGSSGNSVHWSGFSTKSNESFPSTFSMANVKGRHIVRYPLL